VEEVVFLLDPNGRKQGDPHYSNPKVTPGDRLIAVGDVRVESMGIAEVRGLMKGGDKHTQTLTLQRGNSMPYMVTLLRHFHQQSTALV